MTLSTIINIAITLVFVYLASSFIVFALQEKIILYFDLKANNLKKVIYALLGEEQQKGESYSSFSLAEKFYQRYLSLSLNLSKSRRPEQIPAQKFVDDLKTLVAEELKYKDRDFYNEYELTKIIEDINSSDCRFSEKIKRELSAMGQKAINRYQDKGEQLKYLDQELKSWYNTSMEYASDIYRGKMQYLSLILSVIVVLMFNIDTVNIINTLSKSEITSTLISNSKVAEVIASTSSSTSCSSVNNQTESQTCIQDLLTTTFLDLDRIDILPIGWNFSKPLKEQFPLNFSNVIKTFTGWIISMIAISQGAPFWFGVLNNLINFKSSKSAK